MKTRTNKQVIDFVINIHNKYYLDRELFRDACLRYWLKWDLTDQQSKFLNSCKDAGKFVDFIFKSSCVILLFIP